MAATKAKAKATTRTRQVPEEKVPAELRGFYSDKRASESVSLNFTTAPTEEEEPVELEELFSIDGKPYMIPVEFGPGVGLIYLDRIAEGRDVALGEVLKAVIGDEGWQGLLKLAKLNRISLAQLQKIIETVNERTLGAMEASEGN